ncbi:MAG: hypothetical protein AW09_001572 [Candidatus Accumulibacter phosphatis]|uniref:Uncharacterized protein n=1 Tax=Candidatus Accumulibacter phosphatis TaxID=327160 RepID=A0A080LYW4_9PROT|nr:MAG: hypothetical protein AW09_001572 [Candidatus Accumulibacter phosphatis]
MPFAGDSARSVARHALKRSAGTWAAAAALSRVRKRAKWAGFMVGIKGQPLVWAGDCRAPEESLLASCRLMFAPRIRRLR